MDKAYKSLTSRIAKLALILGIVAIATATAIIVSISSLGVSFFSISGSSMEPTLQNRDSIILEQEKKLKTGHIAFFAKPPAWTYEDKYKAEAMIVVKRVAALSGDTLTFDGEAFSVNGEVIYTLASDNYRCSKAPATYMRTLKDGEVFMVGDNPNYSLDSRRVFCDGIQDFLVPQSSIIDFGTIAFKF